MTKKPEKVKRTQLERLLEAGLLVDWRITEAEKKVINELSEQEVEMLIRLRKKWGTARRQRGRRMELIPV
jgi:hypothetical protein